MFFTFQSATLSLTCLGIKLMFFVHFPSLFLQLFFLGGRLIFGPDVRSLVLTVCLIVVPVIFFAATVCPQLGHEFHSQIGGWVASVAVIFTAYVSLWALYSQSLQTDLYFFSPLFVGFQMQSYAFENFIHLLGTTNICTCFYHVISYIIVALGRWS